MELRAPSVKCLAKAAFRQSEVGAIPADWSVEPLASLTQLMTNGFVGVATSHYTDSDSGVLYIQGYNVEENSFNLHGIRRVTEEFHRSHLKSCLREGDLLTVQTGDVGLTTIIPLNLVGANCHALIISRFDQKKVVPKYIAYCLNSTPGRSRLKLIETGTTMKHLNVGDMLYFKVPIPPSLEEQQAIAAALSDADALIESLEQLLAKKRKIKQGAMQELLTGKRRLPGFEGEWRHVRFDSLLRHHSGNSTLIKGKLADSFLHGYFAAYSASGQDVWHDSFEHNGEALVVSAVGSRCGKTFRATGKWSAIANTHVVWVNPTAVNDEFLLLYLNDENFWLKSGSGQPFVLFKQSFARELMLPSLEEQTAIAAVLSDMDADICTLEAKLAKARAIKQGMMQELLTGRIRLV